MGYLRLVSHFDHANIIRYCNRPWYRPWLRDGDLIVKEITDRDGNVKLVLDWVSEEVKRERSLEMTEGLIENHNECVGVNDTVYFLGDFGFFPRSIARKRTEEIVSRLNGKIHWVFGNHDLPRKNRFDDPREMCNAEGFAWKGDGFLDVKIDGKHVVLCHYPMVKWNGSCHGAYHLFGHVHGGLDHAFPDRLCLDAGVDSCRANFRPLNWETIRLHMKEKEVKV